MTADIVNQLMIDHSKQRGLTASLVDNCAALEERTSLINMLRDELLSHAAAEEQTFYAELLAHSPHQIQCQVVDHDTAAELVAQLHELEPGGPEWHAKAALLRASMEDHIFREEVQLIPIARDILTPRRAKLLGKRYERIKQRELETWGTAALKRMAPA